MAAARTEHSSKSDGELHVAIELGSSWKLAFGVRFGDNPRMKTVAARDVAGLKAEIAKAKEKFKLKKGAAVRSCYEAGRDGFWLHRYLTAAGVANLVVDAASIEVQRGRRRRAKTDRVDAVKLLGMLLAHHAGDKRWHVIQIPSPEDEDARQMHRELETLKGERTGHSNRLKALLITNGLQEPVDAKLVARLRQFRDPNGSALGADLQARLVREHERWRLVNEQIRRVEQERRKRLRETPADDKRLSMVRRLLMLKAIGANSAWTFVMEIFSWRQIRNRKQIGALAGLTPTPYCSGKIEREQGISKAGNRRVRSMAIEIGWLWLRWQPDSSLSRWYCRRFGKGSKRQRRIGIVALARKLLVALRRFLEYGEVPEGAILVDWQTKIR